MNLRRDFHSINGYAKANGKYMKNYDKKRIVISQKLPVNGFERMEDTS